MDAQQPPIKPPTEIVINRTLPLQRQKSNFEKQLDSFKVDLSYQQEQLDSFKEKLSESQSQSNKSHKHLKKLNKGFGGFIEDQGRTNREIKTNMANLDTTQLQFETSIFALAQTGTSLEERVKKIEQQNSINQTEPSIPKIIITEHIDRQQKTKGKSELEQQVDSIKKTLSSCQTQIKEHFQQIMTLNKSLSKTLEENIKSEDKFDAMNIVFAKKIEEQKKLAETISQQLLLLTEKGKELVDCTQNNSADILLLRTTIEEQTKNIKINANNILSLAEQNQQLTDIAKTNTENITSLSNLIENQQATIDQQKQSISSIKTAAIASSTISGFALLMWLWYYTNK